AHGNALTHPSLLLSALTCSECNVCESVACPVGISPMRINRLLKRELRAKNLRYDGPLRPTAFSAARFNSARS
ncbi:hypothetical protein FK521_30110, partial [Klebsiella pneumoniae]|nr:hypothetical protein [Klebsiella pneumoniae]